ncbi:hypothetical protein BvCmsSIP004_03616 [Escherichia coli]|nr:hypothetical protein BvCmsSIP004_03616 [Escherichia coli]
MAGGIASGDVAGAAAGAGAGKNGVENNLPGGSEGLQTEKAIEPGADGKPRWHNSSREARNQGAVENKS